jgi:hypothetical protein
MRTLGNLSMSRPIALSAAPARRRVQRRRSRSCYATRLSTGQSCSNGRTPGAERVSALEGSGSPGLGMAQILASRGERVHEVHLRWAAQRRSGSSVRWCAGQSTDNV